MLRLEIKQLTTHFKMGLVGGACMSYPLPPPSTIYGFLRTVTGNKKIGYENIFLSIQGVYKSSFVDLQKFLLQDKDGDWKTNVIKVQELFDCFWVIHIDAPDKIEREIVEGIKNTSFTLRLGRKEDFITSIKVRKNVELKEIEDELPSAYKNSVFYIYEMWNKDKFGRGFLYRVILDRERNNNGEIVNDKWVNLVFRRIDITYDFSECLTDGRYAV